ncbi:hypothetical protein IAT38_004763 [Cryptococcus sp. DSM 104549]
MSAAISSGGLDIQSDSSMTVNSSSTPATPTPAALDAHSATPADLPPQAAAEDDSDKAAPNAAGTNVQNAFQRSINRENFEEEVGQVMGTFNSWWGGVKKQSVSALSTIKADLDKTVTQAQADLEYLRTAKVEVVRKSPAEYEAEREAERSKAAIAAEGKRKGKEKEISSDKELGEETPEAASSASAIFSRITSSTNQLQQALQATLQSTLSAAASNPALSNPVALRSQLAENLRLSSAKENLQLSMKQAEKLAEEYLRKSDQWVKGAEKWMEDAVRVVPPEGEETHVVNVGWDGGDWYSFSTSSDASQIHGSTQDVKRQRNAGFTLALAGSRKDALLRRLREDKELLLVDPEGDAETQERQEEFRQWVQVHWTVQQQASVNDEDDVGTIRMALVPEFLSDEQFWQRYLFHKHMIETEDKKRKLLLQATQQEQSEEFNWDDEPEESMVPSKADSDNAVTVVPASTPTETTPRAGTDGKLPPPAPKLKNISSVATSPRDSEESYDLVSDQSTKAKTAPLVDDDDSDWE